MGLFGSKKDKELEQLKKKAEAGEIEAQVALGFRYGQGNGVERNNKESVKWFTKAAEAGHIKTQYTLGRLLCDLEEHSSVEGVKWIHKAAEAGYAPAQNELGYCFNKGIGVKVDGYAALKWIQKAAAQGNEEAIENLPKIKSKIEKFEAAQKAAEQEQQQKASEGTDRLAALRERRESRKAETPTNASQGNVCKQCGGQLQKGAKFCGGCGAKVEQAQFCTGCGAKMAAGVKFCGECGTAVGGAPVPVPESPQANQPEVPVVEDENQEPSGITQVADQNEERNVVMSGPSFAFVDKFNGIDSDEIAVMNIKIGYTQGELHATESPDYDDGFKVSNHTYWKFTIVKDEGGNTDCDWLILDWANPLGSKCVEGDEEAAEYLGKTIEPSTEEMFGSALPAVCFQSVLQSIFDEPDGYDFIEEVIERIGGEISVDEGDKIDEDFVNSLFAYCEEIDPEAVSIEDGKILLNGQMLSIDAIDDSQVIEKKYAAFSEDVMGY